MRFYTQNKGWTLAAVLLVILGGCSSTGTAPASEAVDSPNPAESSDVANASTILAPSTDWVATSSPLSAARSIHAQAISPDGRWLAEIRDREACVQSLESAEEPICTFDETIGGDSLRWNSESTAFTTGGTLSGSFRNTGIWTIEIDGTATELLATTPGIGIRPEVPLEVVYGAAYRPDAGSIVYADFSEDSDEPDEGVQLRVFEIDLAGERTEIARYSDPGNLAFPLVPLSDGRVVISYGNFDAATIDILDQGRRSTLIVGETDPASGIIIEIPTVVEAQPINEEVLLATSPDLDDTNRPEPEWYLLDFEGERFPLITEGEEVVFGATFSPDGNYVAYLTIERDEFIGEFHVAAVETLLAGGRDRVGSISIDADYLRRPSNVGFLADPQIMRWTSNNQVRMAFFDFIGERDQQVVTIDLS